ncbi:MAG: hypothetical protein RLY93_19905 [Sumerlaeia bacterium]
MGLRFIWAIGMFIFLAAGTAGAAANLKLDMMNGQVRDFSGVTVESAAREVPEDGDAGDLILQISLAAGQKAYPVEAARIVSLTFGPSGQGERYDMEISQNRRRVVHREVTILGLEGETFTVRPKGGSGSFPVPVSAVFGFGPPEPPKAASSGVAPLGGGGGSDPFGGSPLGGGADPFGGAPMGGGDPFGGGGGAPFGGGAGPAGGGDPFGGAPAGGGDPFGGAPAGGAGSDPFGGGGFAEPDPESNGFASGSLGEDAFAEGFEPDPEAGGDGFDDMGGGEFGEDDYYEDEDMFAFGEDPPIIQFFETPLGKIINGLFLLGYWAVTIWLIVAACGEEKYGWAVLIFCCGLARLIYAFQYSGAGKGFVRFWVLFEIATYVGIAVVGVSQSM